MDKRKVIYYSDERNDEFSLAQITPKKIDDNYVYIHDSRFKRFTHFFWYRIIATPIAFAYVKLFFAQSVRGKHKLKKHLHDGFFLYGNHTQDIADPFIPNVITFPKTDYVIVHPNNVSIPVLGRITPSLGALPIPDGVKAYKNFTQAIERRISEGHCIVIYPEAHIWPFYTKIRDFPDTSFAYPAKLGVPVYCFTNTYTKQKLTGRPKIITYIDGPFYPDMDRSVRSRRKELRDKVYKTMCKRAERSDYARIRYIKLEKEKS